LDPEQKKNFGATFFIRRGRFGGALIITNIEEAKAVINKWKETNELVVAEVEQGPGREEALEGSSFHRLILLCLFIGY
jgi:hypothetical protein